MKFKSALVTQASGSVGGITAAHNAGGLYFRSRSIPTDPGSAQQVALRAALTTITSRWTSTVTATQRDAWETYAANVPIQDTLGDARAISGLAHYVRSNVPRLQAGLDLVDEGPTSFSLADPGVLSLDSLEAGTTFDVNFDDSLEWANNDGGALLVYTSRPQSPGINFFKGPYRFADSIDGLTAGPPSSPGNVTAAFPLVGTDKLFVQIRATTADGRLSAPVRLSGVVDP